MGLRAKFNLTLVGVFAIGLGLAGGAIWVVAADHARNETINIARLMMTQALAIRGYTDREIQPLLQEQMRTQFIPNSVPSYAAQTHFGALRQDYPDYRYKEAALNPTNPSDRAADWEADIINVFRANDRLAELLTERDTPLGREIVLSRPLRVASEGCLVCHGRPEEAPQPMLAMYGSANGFGWRLGETIGAQVVSVPLAGPMQRAWRETLVFVTALGSIFVVVLALLNLLLNRMVIRPVLNISRNAERVSMGEMDTQPYVHRAKDELGTLAASFERMRRSLASALGMLEKQ